MAFAQAQNRRPIEGAVATLGVSDRVVFLRKTYAHLGFSLLAFAAACGALLKFAPEVSWRMATIFGSSMGGMLVLLVVLLGVTFAANYMVQHNSSRAIQYAGLGLGIATYVFLFQQLVWILMLKFSHFTPDQAAMIRTGHKVPVMNGAAAEILAQATVITLAIFLGLTLVVFVTKKDFSFLRGALMLGLFGAIGIIFAGALFGFSLGAIFSGFIILLMAGFILHDTSRVMKDYPPTMYVAAAMMLFSSVVTMFFHVLRLIMALRSD